MDDQAPPPASDSPHDGIPRIRMGRTKGTPIAAAKDADLVWYAARLTSNLDDPRLTGYQRTNRRALNDVRAEQVRRIEGR
jgi:hypothetical protein